MANSATVTGKAVATTGDILIRNDSATAPNFRKLKSGQDIYQGDVINTGSNGTAKLLLADRTILDLGASTLFKVDEFKMNSGSDRKVTMSMDYGKIRAAVNTPVGNGGKFNIRTKAATMGVRGTEFIIASDLAEIAPPPVAKTAAKAGPGAAPLARHAVTTQLTVIEGKVVVADTTTSKKAPIAVTKGERLTTVNEVVNDKALAAKVTAEAPAPKVVELSPEQIKATMKEAKIEDKTFKQAVSIDPKASGGPSSGVSTLAEVSTTFSNVPEYTPGAAQIGTPGTFNGGLNPIQVSLPPGQPINVTVVFRK